MKLKQLGSIFRAPFVCFVTAAAFYADSASAMDEYVRFRNRDIGASWFDDTAAFPQPVGGNNAPVNLRYTSFNRGGWPGGMSMRCWRAGDLDFRGSRVNSRWRMTAGFVTSTCRRAGAGNGQSPELTWSAWWVWTGQNSIDDDTQQEIDMVENVPQGNQWNHYWLSRQGGDKFNNPNSAGWLNSWHRYQSSFSRGASVTFRRRTTSGTQTHSRVSTGEARTRALQGRYSQRPWPFNNNRFGGFRAYRNFDVQDVYRQF